MTTRMTERLGRWLTMVPYFVSNPGATYAQAARDLGVTEKQLRKDLESVWMCGLPGMGPGDLIDLDLTDTGVTVSYAAGIERPLKLTLNEATSLLLSLRVLADLPGQADPAAVLRAIDKIGTAVGAGARDAIESIQGAGTVESVSTATVRGALRDGRALALDYYSESRDESTERIVDPIEIRIFDGHSYLRAWCRQSKGERMFRLDRIDSATELDEPAAVPDGRGDMTSLFDPAADSTLTTARLRVGADSAWVLEYHPFTLENGAGRAPDGSVVAAMPYASQEWMTRFVTGFGGDLQVLAPPELADAVAARAAAGLANYR